jgi:hypothetical protein
MTTHDVKDNVNELGRPGAIPRAGLAVAGLVGVAGIAVALLFGSPGGDWSVFFRSYLLNYCYLLTFALGGLFFVMLQHATRAGWSVSLRRLAELVASTMPLFAVLFLPLLIPVLTGMAGVYEWSNVEAVSHDRALQAKAAYLNVPFFVIRCAIYLAIWVLLARYFLRRSVEQDATGDPRLTLNMQWWSAPGILLYALTITFFSIDALMSLNPHWYSTIWGVYFFSGSAVGFFALLAILACAVQASGRLRQAITIEHYHDLGKLAFAFVVFWAYIAFSQYLLIWYGDIPEETVWYRVRQGDHWWLGVSLLLLFGHFFAPFLALLSRYPKRRKGLLALVAAWLLIMHWLDLYYLVAPRPAGAASSAPLHVSDVAMLFGLGGLFVAALVWQMSRHTLLPQRDPRLPEAMTFHNV